MTYGYTACRLLMLAAILMGGILFLAGCGEAPDEPPAGSAVENGDALASDTSGGGDGDPVAGSAVCLQAESFVTEGNLPLGSTSDAIPRRVSAIRWEDHDECERLVIDIEDIEGAHGNEVASPGRVQAEILRSLGLVRIQLRNVEEVDSASTDVRFGGDLARRAYSVRSGEGGWMFVDVHLGSEAEASVSILADPARVVLDLRPGGGPIPPPAATDRRVVVVEPRPGEVAYPIAVRGYSRTFEANVVARLEQGGEEIEETFTTATSWLEAWGYFELIFESGPSGPVVLHVGEYSARDGTWEGVRIEVVVG